MQRKGSKGAMLAYHNRTPIKKLEADDHRQRWYAAV
jgi:hypothetical protein